MSPGRARSLMVKSGCGRVLSSSYLADNVLQASTPHCCVGCTLITAPPPCEVATWDYFRPLTMVLSLFLLILLLPFFFFFFSCTGGLQDLSSPTRDWTWCSDNESTESWPLGCVFVCVCVRTQSCLTVWDLWTVAHRLLCSWDFPNKNTGVGCHFLL